jgi:hypothetical protein
VAVLPVLITRIQLFDRQMALCQCLRGASPSRARSLITHCKRVCALTVRVLLQNNDDASCFIGSV